MGVVSKNHAFEEATLLVCRQAFSALSFIFADHFLHFLVLLGEWWWIE
jgi:hypothetical protein